jgi:hypothetical protein
MKVSPVLEWTRCPAQQFSSQLNPITHVWQTEESGYVCPDDVPTCQQTNPPVAMTAVMPYIVDIHKGLTGAWMSAWLWFRMHDPSAIAGLVGDNYRTKYERLPITMRHQLSPLFWRPYQSRLLPYFSEIDFRAPCRM